MEQLQAHNGTVRCGHCTKVFNADQQLFDDIPAAELPKKSPTGAKKRASSKTKAAPARAPQRAKEKPRAAKDQTDVDTVNDAVLAHKEMAVSVAETTPDKPLDEIFFRRRRRGPGSAWWIAGSVLLLLVLLAQSAYFYRDALAASEILRPTLEDLCERIGCELQPAFDVTRIELIQPTSIAAHPKFDNLLRLRATMVNRASSPQPFPLMEVSLTDTVGNVLARRSFTPAQYLERPALAGTEMLPHVAVSALLDITNPDGKASGYEINFVVDDRR
jgi:hypothetical protein